MINGGINNLLRTSQFFTESSAIKRFDFSKSPGEYSTARISPTPNNYLEYLNLIAPPKWAFIAPHFRLISEHLDAVTRGEIDRLAIFWPPRHGKTETVTVRYPIYRMEHDSDTRSLITGYNESVARRFSRKARTIARDRIGLAEKSGVDEWQAANGAEMVARGVGTPPTGFGFNLICIDDPIKKREEAESAVYREKVWDWYTDDLYTRLEPGGAIILTLTRWHYDDLAARALASEPNKWTVLTLPALAEENDPLGRAAGEALWPERFSRDDLIRIRDVQSDEASGAYAFESLYQQNPTPREGAFFKVGQMQVIDAAPAGLRLCRGWDLAASSGKGDWTAGVKLGVDNAGVWYVLDVSRGQWSPDERDNTLKLTAQLDGNQVRVRLAQDPGQAGVDQSQRLTRMMAGFTVRSERVTGDKSTRASGFAAQVNAGNVRMVRGGWNSAFTEELRQFPLGKHDDQVDAAADAFTELVSGGQFQQGTYRI